MAQRNTTKELGRNQIGGAFVESLAVLPKITVGGPFHPPTIRTKQGQKR